MSHAFNFESQFYILFFDLSQLILQTFYSVFQKTAAVYLHLNLPVDILLCSLYSVLIRFFVISFQIRNLVNVILPQFF